VHISFDYTIGKLAPDFREFETGLGKKRCQKKNGQYNHGSPQAKARTGHGNSLKR